MDIPVAAQAGPGRKAPGRPRSTRVDEAIVDAVLDLLAEGTAIDALSIESVAARAGVGKAAIYRRWSGKDDLVVHAVAALKGPPPRLRGESVRDDLVTLLDAVRRAREARAGRVMRCLVPEVRRSPELYERYQALLAPRREQMRAVIERGVRTGELRSDVDVDLLMTVLVSPVLAQNMLLWDPALDPAALPAAVVDTVLAGVAGPAARRDAKEG